MVDGIGKKPGIGAGPQGVAPAPAAKPAPFAAKTDRAEQVGATTNVAPSQLDRLRKGEIDLDTYLDHKVDEATKHLRALAPSEVAEVRAMLRDRMASDPLLADLVKQATGSVPTPRDD